METAERVRLAAAIRNVVEQRYSERIGMRHEIACELAICWAEAFPHLMRCDENGQTREREIAATELLWDQVDHMLGEVEYATSQHSISDPEQTWRHAPVHRLDEKKDTDDSLALDALASTAASYVKATWAHSPSLERWLVRKMIYAEAVAFGNQVGLPIATKGLRPWWNVGTALAKWLVGVFVALAIAGPYGAASGLLAYVVWVCMLHVLARDGIKARLEVSHLFAHMRTVYSVSMRSHASPLEVERQMSLAESEGAVWPGGLRPILHKALSRNPLVWQ